MLKEIKTLKDQLELYKNLYEDVLQQMKSQEGPQDFDKIQQPQVKKLVESARAYLTDEAQELKIKDLKEAYIICEAMKSIYQENNKKIVGTIDEINKKMQHFEMKQEELDKIQGSFKELYKDEFSYQENPDDEIYLVGEEEGREEEAQNRYEELGEEELKKLLD